MECGMWLSGDKTPPFSLKGCGESQSLLPPIAKGKVCDVISYQEFRGGRAFGGPHTSSGLLVTKAGSPRDSA